MHKIGIIAGGGKLPILIGDNLKKSKYEIIFFCIKNHYDYKLYNKYKHEIITIDSLKKIINRFT